MQDVSKSWAEYNSFYAKLEEVKSEASNAAEKRRVGLKRKLSQAQVGGETRSMMLHGLVSKADTFAPLFMRS